MIITYYIPILEKMLLETIVADGCDNCREFHNFAAREITE